SGQGQIGGLPLANLNATLSLQVKGPMRGSLDAQLAGGDVTATIGPSALGNRLELAGTNLDLETLDVMGFAPGGVIEELSGQIRLSGSPVGTVTGRWAGAVADYSATVNLDGRLDADGLQAFFAAGVTPSHRTDGSGTISAT